MELQEFTFALPAAWITGILAVHRIALLGAKAIPDSAEGWRGAVRMICKLIALYIPNQK